MRFSYAGRLKSDLMRSLAHLIALLLFPWLALAADAPFEIRRAVDENAPGAVKVEYHTGEKTRTLYLEGTPQLTVAHLAKASLKTGLEPETYIEIELMPSGIKLFSDLTAKWQDKMVAVLVNGKVLTAPIIKAHIPSGSLTISGDFSKKEAQTIVEALNEAIGNVPPDDATVKTSEGTLTFTDKKVVYRTPTDEREFPWNFEATEFTPGLKIIGYKEKKGMAPNGIDEVDQSSIMVLGNGIQHELRVAQPVKVSRQEITYSDGTSKVTWTFPQP